MTRYTGVGEQKAKYELLHYLEIDYILSKKRFSRKQLIEELSVPYSVARAFAKGKGRSNRNTYKSIYEADPELAWLIKELAKQCRVFAYLDKIKGNPNIETNIYRR